MSWKNWTGLEVCDSGIVAPLRERRRGRSARVELQVVAPLQEQPIADPDRGVAMDGQRRAVERELDA